MLINAYKDNDDCFSKNVIILGIPYSEYKVRVKLRGKIHERLSSARLLHTINRYKDWIEELNKNEIPYKFVEALGDYKVLEEEEFFRMIK